MSSEKKLFRVEVEETFFHDVYVFAESTEAAEQEIFDIMDVREGPIMPGGTRMDGRTKVNAVGWVNPPYGDLVYSIVNPDADPDID